MKRLAAILVFAAVWSQSACTPAIVAADERGVTLESLPQIGLLNPTLAGHYGSQALIVADDHCRQFGRFARLKTEMPGRIYFECVD